MGKEIARIFQKNFYEKGCHLNRKNIKMREEVMWLLVEEHSWQMEEQEQSSWMKLWVASIRRNKKIKVETVE